MCYKVRMKTSDIIAFTANKALQAQSPLSRPVQWPSKMLPVLQMHQVIIIKDLVMCGPCFKQAKPLFGTSHRSSFCRAPAAGFFIEIMTDFELHPKYMMADVL